MGNQGVTFSFSSVYIKIVENLGKLGLILSILFGLATILLDDPRNQNAVVFCLIFFALGPYLFGELVMSRFTHRIDIDFIKKNIRFHINRRGILEAKFHDIKDVKVRGYVVVKLKNDKMFYNEPGNQELVACLHKIIDEAKG